MVLLARPLRRMRQMPVRHDSGAALITVMAFTFLFLLFGIALTKFSFTTTKVTAEMHDRNTSRYLSGHGADDVIGRFASVLHDPVVSHPDLQKCIDAEPTGGGDFFHELAVDPGGGANVLWVRCEFAGIHRNLIDDWPWAVQVLSPDDWALRKPGTKPADIFGPVYVESGKVCFDEADVDDWFNGNSLDCTDTPGASGLGALYLRRGSDKTLPPKIASPRCTSPGPLYWDHLNTHPDDGEALLEWDCGVETQGDPEWVLPDVKPDYSGVADVEKGRVAHCVDTQQNNVGRFNGLWRRYKWRCVREFDPGNYGSKVLKLDAFQAAVDGVPSEYYAGQCGSYCHGVMIVGNHLRPDSADGLVTHGVYHFDASQTLLQQFYDVLETNRRHARVVGGSIPDSDIGTPAWWFEPLDGDECVVGDRGVMLVFGEDQGLYVGQGVVTKTPGLTLCYARDYQLSGLDAAGADPAPEIQEGIVLAQLKGDPSEKDFAFHAGDDLFSGGGSTLNGVIYAPEGHVNVAHGVVGQDVQVANGILSYTLAMKNYSNRGGRVTGYPGPPESVEVRVSVWECDGDEVTDCGAVDDTVAATRRDPDLVTTAIVKTKDLRIEGEDGVRVDQWIHDQ